MPEQFQSLENPLLAEQARLYFLEQFQVIQENLDRFANQNEDFDTIHDLRVAARRISCISHLIEPYLNARLCQRARDILRPIRKSTNPLRDVTVFLERLQNLDRTLLPDKVASSLIKSMQKEYAKKTDKARHLLGDPKFNHHLDRLTVFLHDDSSAIHLLRMPEKSDAPDLFSLKAVRSAILSRQFAELLALRQRVVVESDLPADVLADPVLSSSFLAVSPKIVHQLRLAGKDFRYALEFLAPVLEQDAYTFQLAIFKDIQDKLGQIHDMDLALIRIAGIERDSTVRKTWREPMERLKRAWREERQTLLDSLQEQWSDWTAESFENKIRSLTQSDV